MSGNDVLVTGSSGLIGSEVCMHFHNLGFRIHGVDNNQRAAFFGPDGDTRWNQHRLQRQLERFEHHELDVRDRAGVMALVKRLKPALLVHTAAQPSHDLAAKIPFDDFDTNAGGTLNLLEAVRQHCADTPFVLMSTNKVYGDQPNNIPLVEQATRWEYADAAFAQGISESLSIDQCLHSLFGASKAAADLITQEYGRYFGLHTCCLRGGCLTGPCHSGVELHGFLSYLVKCNIEGLEYRVHGYKGKQVRDNLHAADVAAFIDAFRKNPRQGEVYNLGGGKDNTCSILEAFEQVAAITGQAQKYVYHDQARRGDHICYYSDLTKARTHYPDWSIQWPLPRIMESIVTMWRQRKTSASN
ncbi:MAG: NAD-dependent epimerase/dehydratase family protein [Phycisphaeraceae bacterium]|nr:NAD-dependent epimerase/dehydratase family protein [Phycisphaeraceae bacterium]